MRKVIERLIEGTLHGERGEGCWKKIKWLLKTESTMECEERLRKVVYGMVEIVAECEVDKRGRKVV